MNKSLKEAGLPGEKIIFVKPEYSSVRELRKLEKMERAGRIDREIADPSVTPDRLVSICIYYFMNADDIFSTK